MNAGLLFHPITQIKFIFLRNISFKICSEDLPWHHRARQIIDDPSMAIRPGRRKTWFKVWPGRHYQRLCQEIPRCYSDYVSTDSAVVTQSPALLGNCTEQTVFPNAFYQIFSFIVLRNSLFIINIFVLLFMTLFFSNNAVTVTGWQQTNVNVDNC
jgi:hypothetical protein